jgi:uncharacterized protein with NAD-binding domain and iron-sulfur cluster
MNGTTPSTVIEDRAELPVRAFSDVVVCGGGPAGIAAAVGAARAGASVTIIERHGCLGGNNTAAMVTSWNNLEREGAPEIEGVYQELVDRLKRIGGIAGTKDGVRQLFFDPEALKYVLDEVMEEAGVDVLFHTMIAKTIVENDRTIGVVIQSKSGREAVLGKVIIDSSGDADIAHSAGVPCAGGRDEDGKMQPGTLKMKVANVDTDKLEMYLAEHPKEVFVQAHLKQSFDGTIREAPRMTFGRSEGEFKGRCYIGFPTAVAKAKADGQPLFTDYAHFHSTSHPGEMMINMARVSGVDGTDVASVSKAEVQGRKEAFLLTQFLRKYIPGFENCYLAQTAQIIGIRETRRIIGEHILTQEECEQGFLFPDTVASAYSTMLDVHDPAGKGFTVLRPLPHAVHVPYRCMVPLKIDGLLVAGRCVSATHVAVGSVRSTHKCMAIGQAAGAAAALAVKHDLQPRKLPAELVQAELKRQGVNFGDVPNEPRQERGYALQPV